MDDEAPEAMMTRLPASVELVGGWFPELSEAERTALAGFGLLNVAPAQACERCATALLLVYWWSIETHDHGRRWDEHRSWRPHTPERCRQVRLG